MTGWLEGLRGTAVKVTLVTVTGCAGIVYPGATCEGCSGMTEMAIQSCRNMSGVNLGVLTNRRAAIMTGCAIVHDAGMIEHRAREAKRELGGMTDTTILAGSYMVDSFA